MLRLTDSRPVVVIYADHLLPASQTFVRAQGEALENHVPVYAGAGLAVGGLALPAGRWTVVNQGGWKGSVEEAVFFHWAWSPKLVRALRQTSPVLMHGHFGPGGVRAMQLASKLAVPLLVTFHGFDATIVPELAPHGRYRRFIRQRSLLARKAARFIAVSNHIKQKLVGQGFPPEKVIVHYIGIDTDFFRTDAAVAREPVVLFVGRLVEKKGCEYLIRAMARLRASYPDVRLVIVGEGPLRAQLQKLAEQVFPNTTFLGAQPPHEVRQWMERASVFCVPSVTAKNGDQEGFGLVFTEAQAVGLPVVSFASGGVPEAVANGETGFLVPERDEEGLARYIALLLDDKQIWRSCSAAGIARVRSQFNLRKQTRILEEIYTAIASETSGRVPAPLPLGRPFRWRCQ